MNPSAQIERTTMFPLGSKIDIFLKWILYATIKLLAWNVKDKTM